MRLDQKKWAGLRAGRVVTLVCLLSASGSGVFAFGQTPPALPAAAPQAPPAPSPATTTITPAAGTPQDAGLSTTRISSEDAVKMALENNLGIRAEQLTPQIQNYSVAQARAVFAPSVVSQTTSRSSTTPPGNFL